MLWLLAYFNILQVQHKCKILSLFYDKEISLEIHRNKTKENLQRWIFNLEINLKVILIL